MTNEEEKVIEWLKNTSLDEMVQKIFCYISRLEGENKHLKKELDNCNELEIAQDIAINKLQADKNKLINYIAIKENKTHEEVCKEFEV
jgi:hypothetical protein